jgi:hypothetical protein
MNPDRFENNWKQFEGKKKYQYWNFSDEQPDSAGRSDPLAAEAREPSTNDPDTRGRGKLASRIG